MYDDEDEDQDDAKIETPAFHDRYGDTLMLLAAVMSAKETRKKLLRLRKLDRDIAAASTRLAAVQAVDGWIFISSPITR
jgi:hypothetical protein